jgi:zinc/manganese transport system substrate-binding protein
MHRPILLTSSLALAGLIAVSTPLHATTSGKLKVVATITILGDMVEQVADGHVTLTTLVGPNGDAHVFEPTPANAKVLSEADLVVVNGLGLEGWMDRLIQASGYRGPIVVASRGVLDAEVRKQIAEIPPERRKVVTSHDAFGYFGAAYGVQFVAPEGISEDAEPSAADMKRLIDQIRREHIKVMFFENALSPRLVQQIGSETGAVVGGTLYADALSEPGGPADTYLKMFEHNVPLLRLAMLVQG